MGRTDCPGSDERHVAALNCNMDSQVPQLKEFAGHCAKLPGGERENADRRDARVRADREGSAL